MKTKIAHFADTHLGYRQYSLSEREKDFYEQFDKIIDDMIEKDVDAIIHSGDLFENPKPPINALLTAQKGFNKLLEHDIKIYVISGNHDQMQKSNTSIPQKLFENENFNILDVHNPIQIFNGIFIGGLNYITPNFQKKIKEKLEEIKEKSEDYKFKILVLHGGTSKYDDYSVEFDLNTLPEGFDYYAMGHIHKRILDTFKEGKLAYPGSTEIRSRKEVEEFDKKGYNIITFDDEKEEMEIEEVYVPLTRRFIKDEFTIDKLEEKLSEIKKDIMNDEKKPIVDLTIKKGNFERLEIKEKIMDKIKDYALYIKFNYTPTNSIPPEGEEFDNFTPEKLINDTEYPDEEKRYIIDLYHTLSASNMEEAMKITEEYYQNRMCSQDDN